MKSKIQLPWVAEDIKAEEKRALKTKQFWELSQAWNTHLPLTIQDAISLGNSIQAGLDPNSKVSARTSHIQQNLIVHGTKSAFNKFQRMHETQTETTPAKMIIM